MTKRSTKQTNKGTSDALYTPTQAAELLNVSAGTLEEWRHRGGRGPRFLQITRRTIRYRGSDLEEFLAARSRG